METSALEAGTIIAGRYRVTSKIGQGGMGAVYEVQHVHTDESLALKVLHPQVLRDASLVERFRREARAPAKIASEHVARVTDADTAADLDNAPFYVMELLRGRDLEALLQGGGPLEPALVVEYLRQAARALDKAHALGIIHRDLKPENLFLTHREDGSPCVKLLDFGIARLGDNDGRPGSTQVGYIFGTPNYMAPEQTLGDPAQVGPATDVWALGLVAFKLLVGSEYFDAPAVPQLYAKILSEPLTAPSARGATFGEAFDAWFFRCVARDVGARFTSAGDAIRGLAAALGVVVDERYPSSASLPILPAVARTSDPSIDAAAGGEAGSDASPAGVPAPGRGPRLAILGGAGIAVALAVVAFVVLLRRPSEAASFGIVGASAAPLPCATPPAEAESAPAAAESAASSSAAVAASSEPRKPSLAPAAPRGGPARAPATATAENRTVLTRDQRKRLESLDRLCNQGTYAPAECQTKRQAIVRGDP